MRSGGGGLLGVQSGIRSGCSYAACRRAGGTGRTQLIISHQWLMAHHSVGWLKRAMFPPCVCDIQACAAVSKLSQWCAPTRRRNRPALAVKLAKQCPL
jgi:hypothetical protein